MADNRPYFAAPGRASDENAPGRTTMPGKKRGARAANSDASQVLPASTRSRTHVVSPTVQADPVDGDTRHTRRRRVDTVPRRRSTREEQALTASRHSRDLAGRGAPGAKRPRRAVPPEPGPGVSPAGCPPSGGSSWYYAKNVSALLPPDADLRKQRRHVRYALRDVLWRESSLERVRKCGRVPVTEVGDVVVKDNGGVAHYAGIATCGSISACPVCSAKIRAKRADEISQAVARWDSQGGAVYMATFTVQHDFGMRLGPLLGMIANSFRVVLQGRRWMRLKRRLGIVGNIRSLEVTVGLNGWHPHLHVLFMLKSDTDPQQLAEFIAYLRGSWQKAVMKAGYRKPSDHYGVKVDRCYNAGEAGEYIAKTQDGRAVGNELTREDLKQSRKGRTPFDVLDDFRWTGDAADLALWHEYEKAMWRKQIITWSPGLKALLLVEDKKDEEIAEEEIGGEDVAVIPNETWRQVTRVFGLSVALLDAAESGRVPAMARLLTKYGIDAGPLRTPG